jgi:S1-C subfamily serine protease
MCKPTSFFYAERQEEFMDDFTKVLEHISPSIVEVNGRRGYSLSGVVWSENIIVTTNRAVERDENIQITLSDGSTHAATLVGRDPRTDLAILKVEGKLKTASWKDTKGLKIGQWLLRVGRPDGLRATHGILSYLSGVWRTAWGGRIDEAIHTDADTFTGFSGGAVITASGDLIGINTAALNRRGDAVIPTSTVKRVVASILEHGHVRRGYLGISTQAVKLPESLKLEQQVGLLIVSVEENSPAATSGLALGDVIIHFDGQAIQNPGELMSSLENAPVKQPISIKILRGGQLQDMKVEVGER